MEESAKDAEPGTCIYINVTHYRKDRAVVCYAKNHIRIVPELTYSSVDLSPPGTHTGSPYIGVPCMGPRIFQGKYS